MKRFYAVTIFLFTCLTAPVTLVADNVLVFGTYFTKATLVTSLESLGHTVTNSDGLPADLSGFNSIWHVDAFTPIVPEFQTRLAAYLAAGGGLHLTGERPCCEALNDSLQQFVNSVVVGGGIQVGDLGDIAGPYTVNPAANGGLATTPNAVSVWEPLASGGMGGLGNLPDPNIMVAGNGNVPVGAVWLGSELVSGMGQLTLLMDTNWFSQPSAGDNLAIIENIQTFLSGNVVELANIARFPVTKTFTDGSTDEVDVTLTCNSGLPLQQSATIAGGEN